MRSLLVFALLAIVQALSLVFYRVRIAWVGERPPHPWRHLRLVAFMNHTSLFEPIFAGGVPLAFSWRLARHGLVPAAQKTISRPLVGLVFRLIAKNVVPISRQRDHTWREVLDSIDPDSMVVLAPEGRMKRANGLDLQGRRMTVRGGIADILEAIPSGGFLLAHSGGLHHVQIPGQRLPRLFQPVGMMLELLEIESYREAVRVKARGAGIEFKEAVRLDLEERRDRHCRQAAALAGVEYLEPSAEALAEAATRLAAESAAAAPQRPSS